MKAFAGCYGGHTSMLAIVDQMKEHNFAPEDIGKIHFDLSPVSWQLTGNPWEAKMNPPTAFACQFSLPYLVATVAYDKDVFLTSFTPEARDRQHIQELMKRITGSRDTNLPPWSSRIHITLRDGRSFSREYFYTDLPGTRNKRFNEMELNARFKRCIPYSSYKLDETTVDLLLDKLRHLEQVDDVIEEVIIPLTPR
jgi:2-methylcitrate dehydratase PrpD